MKARDLSARIGVLLRDLRKDRGHSQRAAADAVGAAQPKLSLLEQGRLDFGALALVSRLADWLGVSTVDVLASAFPESATEVHPRLDRPWLVSASRYLTLATERGGSPDPARAPSWTALTALSSETEWVTRLVRARAFGVVHGAHAGGWILPFAPSLIRQACDEFVASDAARGLALGARERIVEQVQRFAVAYELTSQPAEALAVLDRLGADYAIPEVEYLRGVLMHQLGEPPLRVKGCVHRALDRLEALPPTDPRADWVVAGLLEYLDVAAEASERGDPSAPQAEQRIDHAIRLLGLAGFDQGRVHLEVRRAVRAHEQLRRARREDASSAKGAHGTPAHGEWQREWAEVASTLARARAEYQAMGLAMGAAYAEDWLARHHEMRGDHQQALTLVIGVIEVYRRLGQRRWELSAHARAAYCREQLAFAALGVDGDAQVNARRLSGSTGARAMALVEATRERVSAVLSEGNVTPYERPALEVHLALAVGRLVAWHRLGNTASERIDALSREYRERKRAALAHHDEEIEASVAAHREAAAGFRALERAYPMLAGAGARATPKRNSSGKGRGSSHV